MELTPVLMVLAINIDGSGGSPGVEAGSLRLPSNSYQV